MVPYVIFFAGILAFYSHARILSYMPAYFLSCCFLACLVSSILAVCMLAFLLLLASCILPACSFILFLYFPTSLHDLFFLTYLLICSLLAYLPASFFCRHSYSSLTSLLLSMLAHFIAFYLLISQLSSILASHSLHFLLIICTHAYCLPVRFLAVLDTLGTLVRNLQ